MTVSKPNSPAFVIDPKKRDLFFSETQNSAKKTLERFFAHRPKKGVSTPYKKNEL